MGSRMIMPSFAMSLAARYVKPELFEILAGYTPKAVERKIQKHVWIEGHEFIKAPDGNILVDLVGYQKWVESDGHNKDNG